VWYTLVVTGGASCAAGYNPGMIVELPLITAEEIAAEYRPGGGVTVKAIMRRLREKELVSEGVGEHPRGPKGTVVGALHVYSALNLDAARAARSGDLAAARKLAKSAKRIEQRRATTQIVRGIAGMGGAPSMRTRLQWVADYDEMLREALENVVAETAAERRKLVEGARFSAPRLAYIVKIHGAVAEVQLDGANESISLPVVDLDMLDSAFVGAALALRWEPFGPGRTLITAAPAMKLGDGDESAIYPYERPLPDAAAPIALAGALVAGATINRPRRIQIAGRR